MFVNSAAESPPSKCTVWTGVLPRFIDPWQLPSKVKPFSTVMDQPFTYNVDLVLPKEIYETVQLTIENNFNALRYSRVIMSLSDLLERNFFNHYVKIGNIMMLSENRPSSDSKFSLLEGILRLELPKEVYEQTGLTGKETRDGGRKHLKSRYVIEINLRQPSMLRGKKGFERIVWAFKHVLTDSVSWLFYDFKKPPGAGIAADPFAKHHPIHQTVAPTVTHIESAKSPSFTDSQNSQDDEVWLAEFHEWVGLVALQSPRVEAYDRIDPYLCRYSIPSCNAPDIQDLLHLKWSGFFPAVWIRKLLVELCTLTKSFTGSRGWFVLCGHAFPTGSTNQIEGYTILRAPTAVNEDGSRPDLLGTYVLWEMSKCVPS